LFEGFGPPDTSFVAYANGYRFQRRQSMPASTTPGTFGTFGTSVGNSVGNAVDNSVGLGVNAAPAAVSNEFSFGPPNHIFHRRQSMPAVTTPSQQRCSRHNDGAYGRDCGQCSNCVANAAAIAAYFATPLPRQLCHNGVDGGCGDCSNCTFSAGKHSRYLPASAATAASSTAALAPAAAPAAALSSGFGVFSGTNAPAAASASSTAATSMAAAPAAASFGGSVGFSFDGPPNQRLVNRRQSMPAFTTPSPLTTRDNAFSARQRVTVRRRQSVVVTKAASSAAQTPATKAGVFSAARGNGAVGVRSGATTVKKAAAWEVAAAVAIVLAIATAGMTISVTTYTVFVVVMVAADGDRRFLHMPAAMRVVMFTAAFSVVMAEGETVVLITILAASVATVAASIAAINNHDVATAADARARHLTTKVQSLNARTTASTQVAAIATAATATAAVQLRAYQAAATMSRRQAQKWQETLALAATASRTRVKELKDQLARAATSSEARIKELQEQLALKQAALATATSASSANVVAAATAAQRINALENAIEYHENNESEPADCCICMQAPTNSAFMACGHACVCVDCGKQLLSEMDGGEAKCPVCRVVVSGFMQVFI
jgi:hypothetical protein